MRDGADQVDSGDKCCVGGPRLNVLRPGKPRVAGSVETPMRHLDGTPRLPILFDHCLESKGVTYIQGTQKRVKPNSLAELT